MHKRVGIAIVAVFLVCVCAVAPAVAQETNDPVRAQTFRVEFKPLTEAAELIDPLLTEQGSVLMRPRQRRLIVEDRASVLARIGQVLESFDLPPRSVEVTVNLFLGRREESPSGKSGSSVPLSREVRGVIETLGDFTKWTAYEPLGSGSVIGVEGAPLETSLTAEYVVSFTVESVHESGAVKFERFSLQRIEHDEDGVEHRVDLYTAGMVVDAGDLTLLVAASGPDADRALFLALQAEPR